MTLQILKQYTQLKAENPVEPLNRRKGNKDDKNNYE